LTTFLDLVSLFERPYSSSLGLDGSPARTFGLHCSLQNISS
jgi:hypothetical protein